MGCFVYTANWWCRRDQMRERSASSTVYEFHIDAANITIIQRLGPRVFGV